MSMPGAQQGGLHPFQSAPGVEAGGNRGEGADRRDRGRFNPPPALRPGGSRRPTPKASRRGTFQSAPGVEAGGNGLALERLTEPGEQGTRTDFNAGQGEESLMDVGATLIPDAK